MKALCIENLSYSLGEKQILEKISLQVEKGEFIGLIGPNGAGKTTLLKNINRINKGCGDIWVQGKNIKNMGDKELARQVALMKQETQITFPFTCWEVVLMGRYPYLSWTNQETEEDREIAQKCMEYTDTCHLADKKVTALSGGERQRVLFAKVLTQEAPLILLDEPTSNLDMAHQEQIFRYSRQFCRNSGSIVAAVHDLRIAAKYCSRLVLLYQGRIIADGPVAEVFTSENLQKAYGVECCPYYNSLTGEWDIYMPECKKTSKKGKVHIIGGGGSATALLRELYQCGYQLSLGIVHEGDSDTEIASLLGIEKIVLPACAPLSVEAYELNKKMIEKADWTILTSCAFGMNNLPNLQIAQLAQRLVIIDDSPIEKRDFTNGQATCLYKELSQKAVMLKSADVINFLQNKENKGEIS